MTSAFSFLRKMVSRKKKPQPPKHSNRDAANKPENEDSPVLAKRLELIKKRLGESKDVVIREFSSSQDKVKMAILFIDGMVDKKIISDNVIRPLLSDTLANEYSEKLTPGNALKLIKNHIVFNTEVAEMPDLTQALKMVLAGDTALFIDGVQRVIIFGTRGWEKRPVMEPETEAAVRGGREGFTETMRINTALIRRRIKHENLRIETMKVGRRTATDINLVYINDIVNKRTLDEVRKRIAAIDTDAILESGHIEE